MGVNVIRAVVNMNSSFVVNIDKEGAAAIPSGGIGTSVSDAFSGEVVRPFEARGGLDFPIPWCRSAEEFGNLHLRLEFFRPTAFPPGISVASFRIWQESLDGVDRARFSEGTSYVRGARALVGDRNGSFEYDTGGNSDVLLVVDERGWVILTFIR